VKATVKTCTARQDGGYLLILSNGRSGVSPVAVPEGSRVKVDASGKVVANV